MILQVLQYNGRNNFQISYVCLKKCDIINKSTRLTG